MGQELMGEQQQQQHRPHSEVPSSRKRHIFADNNPQHVEAKSVQAVPNPKKLGSESRVSGGAENAQMQANQRYVGSPQKNRMDYSQNESVAFSEIPPAERYPTKISYFNAWSLPIQKYYKDQRGPYQAEEQPAVVQQRREMRQFNAEALEQLMAQQMKREMTNNNRRRRQNLNMV